MWNREESQGGSATGVGVQPAAAPEAPGRASTHPKTLAANLGRSVAVKGELTGSEDLTVDGRVEGSIDLSQHALTIGPNAIIHARIVAKVVTVFGSVVGNMAAGDMIIRKGASVQGDLSCTRLAIQDGAHFCGKVDMAARGQAKRGHHAAPQTPALAEAV